MAFEIDFSDEAHLDLHEARDYYFKISEDLLVKFDKSIIQCMDSLEENPQNFRRRYRNVNNVFTKTLPYGIHYLIGNKTISIQRILHQKQLY